MGYRYSPLHPEDQAIVDIAQQLCQQLGIKKLNPQIVSWIEKMGRVRVQPDAILFLRDTILISKSVQGILEPEEWRPLLASSLLYHWKYQRRIFQGFMLRTTPVILLIFLGLVTLDRLLGGNFGLFRIILGFVFLPLTLSLIVYTQILSFRYMKRVWFISDREATQATGPGNLLQGLRKIEALGLERGGLSARLMARPSISQRINSLQSQGPA